MSSEIQRFLKAHGPSRASKVKDHLKSKGLSETASRQQISRAIAPVIKLPIRLLPKNEAFLYLKDQLATDDYYASLHKALLETGTVYGSAIRGIQSKGGFITAKRFRAVSGAPVKKRVGKLMHDLVEKTLIDSKLILKTTIGDEDYFSPRFMELTPMHIANLEYEKVVISMVADWIKKMNLGSYNKVQLSTEEETDCGGYSWDIVAPSYISGVTKKKNSKLQPGFCVADVYLNHNGRTLTKEDIAPVIKKFEAMMMLRNLGNIIPILVHEGMSEDVFSLMKSKGFIVAQTDVIFGKEAAELLRSLKGILGNLSESLKEKPEETIKVFEKISKIEGASFNLRGPLFEFIVGYIHTRKGYAVNLRKMIHWNTEKTDVDVDAIRGSERLFIECKGLSKGNSVTKDDIDKWLSKQIPVIRNWYNFAKNNGHAKETDEYKFYYSGNFTDEVKSYALEKANKTKKYKIAFHDFTDIEAELKKLNEKPILDLLKEQFGQQLT